MWLVAGPWGLQSGQLCLEVRAVAGPRRLLDPGLSLRVLSTIVSGLCPFLRGWAASWSILTGVSLQRGVIQSVLAPLWLTLSIATPGLQIRKEGTQSPSLPACSELCNCRSRGVQRGQVRELVPVLAETNLHF